MWHYGLLIYEHKEDGSVVRKIPYKTFCPSTTEDVPKIRTVILNTKKFIRVGERVFRGDDHLDAFKAVDEQAWDEGWYNPMTMKTYLTSISESLFEQIYGEYNRR